jgi:two-component sensor histidine kinase
VKHPPALSGAIAEVFITEQLSSRIPADPDYLKEKLAIQDLARHMSDRPKEVLPRLVQLALEICDASSCGVSVLEPQSGLFRWFGLKGVLSAFEGATTPRNFSPCGICLDFDGPVLMAHPERAYDWIRDANISVPEVLLVPLNVPGLQSIGTLWIVAHEGQHFDIGHARIMTELATFAATALRMIQTEEQLSQALQYQETLTREMSHRVKNLFALSTSMIRLSARSAADKDDLAEKLIGRLEALAEANALVRRSPDSDLPESVDLCELIARVLRPHDHAHALIDGPPVAVGGLTTNNLALVFHELATNAAKYGSLSSERGSVAVVWRADNSNIVVSWKEAGGPPVTSPDAKGFGSRLVASTIAGMGGRIDYDWTTAGLAVNFTLPLGALKS